MPKRSPPSATDLDALLTTRELAHETRLSERFYEKRRLTGEGPPFIRLGRRGAKGLRYRRGAVLEWLRAREFASIAAEYAHKRTTAAA